MRNRCIAFLFVVAGLALACGGTDVEPETPADQKPAEPAAAAAGSEHGEAAGHENHHPDLPTEVNAFHEMLAPLWHAKPGEQRQSDTCAKLDELKAGAETMASSQPEGVDADKWSAKGAELVSAITALGGVCGGEGDFAAGFQAVHDAFHHCIELLPGVEPHSSKG